MKGTASMSIGQAFELASLIVSQIPSDLSTKDVQYCIENPATLAGLRKVLSEMIRQENQHQTVRVSIDGLSLEEMVEAGKYDYANSNINSGNFPVGEIQSQEEEVYLVHFDRSIGSEEVIRELDKMGLEPADIVQLLAIGEQYPELQRQFPIIALGSVWTRPGGSRYVPELWGGAAYRELGLGWFEGDWNPYYRFAAVRKKDLDS